MALTEAEVRAQEVGADALSLNQYLKQNEIGSKSASWSPGRTFDANARLNSSYDAGGSIERTRPVDMASRSRELESFDTRVVDNILQRNRSVGISAISPPERSAGALTSDQIFQLYQKQTPSTYQSPPNFTRLRILQEQSDRDARVPLPGISSIFVSLVRDIRSITASSTMDFFAQVFIVLRSGNRPLYLGFLMVLFGLIGLALAKPNNLHKDGVQTT